MRDATPDDAPAMLRVLESAFPRWPAFDIDVPKIEHLRWKMEAAGFAARHPLVLIDDEIVALKLRWLGRGRVYGREYVTDTGVDFAVDRSAQGRGIGSALRDHEAGYTSAGAFGMQTRSRSEAAREVMRADEKVGRPLNVWLHTVGPREFMLAYRRGGLTHAFRAGLAALRHRKLQQPAFPGTIVGLERFDQRTDALWERVRDEYDVAGERTAEFLNWRYADPRSGPASILAIVDRDEVLGVLVSKRDGETARILDLYTDPRHPGVGTALLHVALQRAKSAGLRPVSCWLPPGHREESSLRAAGFLDTGEQPEVEFDVLSGAPPELRLEHFEAPGSYHVMLGDFDWV